MFKKPFKVSTSNQLSNKDKKSLKEELKKFFDPTTLDKVFEQNPVIQQVKLQSSKMIVYSTDQYPVFIDSTGKNDIFPTLYAIFAYPSLVKSVTINSGVESYIFNGANLMWPGVDQSVAIEEFKKDDVRVITTKNGNFVGIGAMANDYAEYKKGLKEGIAIYLLHFQGDQLWEFGNKKIPELKYDANRAKQLQNLTSVQEPKQEDKKDDSDFSNDDAQEDLTQLLKNVKKQPQKVAQTKKVQQFSDEENDDHKKKKKNKKKNDEEEEVKEKQKEKKEKEKPEKKEKPKDEKEDKEEKESSSEEESPQNIAQNDLNLREAFLNAIKVGITDKQLPVDSSAFYQQYILAFRNESVTIDVKNTSFKKIGKFYTQMAKEGLIEYKEAKKNTQPQISKIFRNETKYEDWQPTTLKPIRKEVEEEKPQESQFKTKIEVIPYYKVTDSLVPIFLEKDKLLTSEEAKKKLNEYLSKNCKAEKKLWILTDEIISKWFLNCEEDDNNNGEEGVEGAVKKKKEGKASLEEIWSKATNQFQHMYRITNLDTKQSEMKQGQFKGLQIIAEKSHNKNITKVHGLELFGFEVPTNKPAQIKEKEPTNNLNALSAKFQVQFACSVSIHELPGGKTKELVVHGNFLQELVDFFSNECKIDASLIHSQNKLEKKKK